MSNTWEQSEDNPKNFKKVNKPCNHMKDVVWYADTQMMVSFDSAEEICWHCAQCYIHYDGDVSE